MNPAPEVSPIYLRRGFQAFDSAAKTVPGKVAESKEPAAADATLVDAITRSVSDLLARSLHETVTAAVRALAPKMKISLLPSDATGVSAEGVQASGSAEVAPSANAAAPVEVGATEGEDVRAAA